jgi:hypothetical protein
VEPERDAVLKLARQIVRAYSRDDRREPNGRDLEIAQELHTAIAAERAASAAAMREACAAIADTSRLPAPWTPDAQRCCEHAERIAFAIRALPLPSASTLAAMIEGARREGMSALLRWFVDREHQTSWVTTAKDVVFAMKDLGADPGDLVWSSGAGRFVLARARAGAGEGGAS